jgi:hypothetical protein
MHRGSVRAKMRKSGATPAHSETNVRCVPSITSAWGRYRAGGCRVIETHTKVRPSITTERLDRARPKQVYRACAAVGTGDPASQGDDATYSSRLNSGPSSRNVNNYYSSLAMAVSRIFCALCEVRSSDRPLSQSSTIVRCARPLGIAAFVGYCVEQAARWKCSGRVQPIQSGLHLADIHMPGMSGFVRYKAPERGITTLLIPITLCPTVSDDEAIVGAHVFRNRLKRPPLSVERSLR